MLEIFLLIALWKNLGKMAADKGRPKAWALVSIGFWLVGEFTGMFIGGLLELGLGAYLLALTFAALGATVGWLVVKSLPAVPGYEPTGF